MATISLLGVRRDFIIHQGNTFKMLFSMLDAEGDPLDMTGDDINMQIRDVETGRTVITLSLSNLKMSWTSAANGTWEGTVSPSDTSLIKFTSDTYAMQYDVEVTSSVYGIYKPYWGLITLKREMTRTP